MYNVTINTPFEDKTANFMDKGIHENVVLDRIEAGTSKNDNEFIAFYFIGSNGEKGSHTEYKPKHEDPAKLAEKELNQISRIKQIATCFIPEEKFVFSANSFKEFVNKTISLIGDSYKDVKLRVKMVYSGKYTSLPSYWKFRFIERMDAERKITWMSIDEKDRVTSDPIPSVTNPFDTNENPFKQ